MWSGDCPGRSRATSPSARRQRVPSPRKETTDPRRNAPVSTPRHPRHRAETLQIRKCRPAARTDRRSDRAPRFRCCRRPSTSYRCGKTLWGPTGAGALTKNAEWVVDASIKAPCSSLLEAILAVPPEEMRMWSIRRAVRRKRLTGFVDDRSYPLGIVRVTGDQYLQVIR
jgi:hypothetical protein